MPKLSKTMNHDDRECLVRFAETRSEEAFRGLVEGHLGMVFATARRQLNGDGALAEDVAQQAFVDLAQKAGSRSLPRDVVVGGWLYRHTVFLSRKAVRTESRRRKREGIAVERARIESEGQDLEEPWRQFSPLVDEAMARLRPCEREAIVLRYLEGHPLRAVGKSLGVSEDTARKRVSRAIEKLRVWLGRRGVAVSASGLAMALGSESAEAAVPAGLSTAIVGESLREMPAATTGFLAGVAVPNFLAAALGVAITLLAGATIVRPDASTEPPPGVDARKGPLSALVPGSATKLRGTIAADGDALLPLDQIVKRVRALAGKPATFRTRAELAALIARIAPDDLAKAAAAFSGTENSRGVWFAVMPALFDRWTKFDVGAAFEFYASALRSDWDRRPFNKMLRDWKPDPDQAKAARDWLLGVANGESSHPLRGPSGLMTDTGAEIALKGPADFEAFLAAIPSIEAVGSQGYLLPDTIRKTTLGRIYKISLEEQRVWAESLADPVESSHVILSLLDGVLKGKAANQARVPGASVVELADWAWETLPVETREAQLPNVLRQLSRRNVEEAIGWYRSKADQDSIDRVAINMVAAYHESRVGLAWADAISDPATREAAAAGVFRRWARAPEMFYGAYGPTRTKETAAEYLASQGQELAPQRRARFEAILANP